MSTYTLRLSYADDSPIKGGYGLNQKFLARIEEPIANSIEIKSRSDLEKIGKDPLYQLNADYILTEDIDLAGAEWTPISGAGIYGFGGTFDGQGHVIRNMTVTGEKRKAGLFATVSGTVKNLGMEGTNIDVLVSGSNYDIYAGALAASADVQTYYFINCYNEGLVSAKATAEKQSSHATVGGLVGLAYLESGDGHIANCCNAATVTGESYSISSTGGIVGNSQGSLGTTSIVGCRNYGDVTAKQTCPVNNTLNSYVYGGGIAGEGENFVDCVNEGNIKIISNTNGYAGGMAGFVGIYGRAVSNCSNFGMIESIAGEGTSSTRGMLAYAGGLVGKVTDVPDQGVVSGLGCDHCVNSGGILALVDLAGKDKQAYAGGLIGYGANSRFVDCANKGYVLGDAKGNLGGISNAVLAGGLAAFAEPSQTLRCGNYGKIEASLPPKTYEHDYLCNAAGLISSFGANVAIKLSTNKGEIVSDSVAAGLADRSCDIENSYNTGDISGQWAGGIVGTLMHLPTRIIDKTYSSGLISGKILASGIAVDKSGSETNFLISNSVVLSPSIESESGTSSVITSNANIGKYNSYALGGIQGADYDGCPALTEGQEKTQEFYGSLGWNFDSDWKMPRSEDGYPLLMWEVDDSAPPVKPSPTDIPGGTTTDSALTPIPSEAVPEVTDAPEPSVTVEPVPTVTDVPAATVTEVPEPSITDVPKPSITDKPEPSITDKPLPTATDKPLPTSTSQPKPSATATPAPTAKPTSKPPSIITATPKPPSIITATPKATATPIPLQPKPSSTPTPNPLGTPITKPTAKPLPTQAAKTNALKTVEELMEQDNIPVYAPKAEVTAQATSDTLNVSGRETAVPALKVDGFNYLKIRDFAALLSATNDRFSVEWDPDLNLISIASGLPYQPTKDDLAEPDKDLIKATASEVNLVVNGRRVKLQALNADGYNYISMRVLAELMGFEVSWENGVITLAKRQ
jgi:hypothetical protein